MCSSAISTGSSDEHVVQCITHKMQAEEVQAWLKEPTPSTRDILVVVPDVSSYDNSMYIAVPEREAWQTPDCRIDRSDENEPDNRNDQELQTFAIEQLLVVAILCFFIIGNVIQSLIDSYRA